jgi:hypothetical protein
VSHAGLGESIAEILLEGIVRGQDGRQDGDRHGREHHGDPERRQPGASGPTQHPPSPRADRARGGRLGQRRSGLSDI